MECYAYFFYILTLKKRKKNHSALRLVQLLVEERLPGLARDRGLLILLNIAHERLLTNLFWWFIYIFNYLQY